MMQKRGTVTFVIGERTIVKNYYGKESRAKLIESHLPLFLSDKVCYYTIAPATMHRSRNAQIRYEYKKGGVTMQQLSERYKLSSKSIKTIVTASAKEARATL